MFLTFKTDHKVQYMLQVFEDETLKNCLKKIQELHPINRADLLFLNSKSGSPLDLNTPISEIGLKDRDVLWIDYLNENQRLPRRTLSSQPLNRSLLITRSKSEGS